MVDRIRRYPKAARNVSSAALLAIGVLALYNWVLAPHVGYLHAVQRLGPVMGRVTEERERISSTLDGKVGQWRALQRDRAELDEGVFTVDGAKTFVRGLLPLVEETGCAVVRADFSPDAKRQQLGEPNLPVVIEVSQMNLDVRGQCDQVSVLLQRLRDSRPHAWIDSCQCDFSGGDAGQVECHLVLTLYILVDRKEPARESSELVAGGAQMVP
jgi:hypothetical protein